MNKLQRLQACGLAVALTTVLLASLVQADEGERRRSWGRPAVQNLEVSGVYTGVLGGQVLIGGLGYPLSESVQVFRIGEGLVPIQEIPVGTMVFAMGSGRSGVGTIETLFARPKDESGASLAPATLVRERNPALPR